MKNLYFACATDDNYVVPTYITIHSLLQFANNDNHYNIAILVPDNLTTDNVKFLKSLEDRFSYASISTISMGDAFSSSNITIKHTTLPSMYRLLLSELLPEVEKCIYVDVDVIFCGDISGLFNIDMNDYYVGAVRDIEAKTYINAFNYDAEKPDPAGYINSGLLVMNLDKIRKDNLVTRFLELSKQRLLFADQDIINIACKDHILYLDLKYNALVKYRFLNYREKNYPEHVTRYFSVKEIHEAIDNPVMIHYAQPLKPWQCPYMYKGNYWYKYINAYIGKDIKKQEIKKFIDSQKCTRGIYVKSFVHWILYKIGILRLVLKYQKKL